MAPRGMIAVTTVLLCFILGLLGPAPAALGSSLGKDCCTRYNRKPVHFQRIKGYREQTTKENCHIEAIIFYTVNKNEICATRKDEWVRKVLELLSSKLKKMSKTGSAAGENSDEKKENRHLMMEVDLSSVPQKPSRTAPNVSISKNQVLVFGMK